MELSYIFSRNKKIGSRAIAWASSLIIKDMKKVPSHVALLIELEDKKIQLVVESVLEQGFRIVPYKAWLTINEQCYIIPETNKTLEDVVKAITPLWNKKYDWYGIAYFGYCFVKHFLFKSPFPKVNILQKEDRFFCTEAVAEISGYEKSDMVTPAKMCRDLLILKGMHEIL